MSSRPHKPSSSYDVELLTADGIWEQLGAKPSSPPPIARAKPRRVNLSRIAAYVAGALLSLGLHALLLSSALLGTPGKVVKRPLTEGAAASAQNENATEFVSTLLILNDHSITQENQPLDDSAYSAVQAIEQQIKNAFLLTSLDAVAAPEIGGSDEGETEDSSTTEATGDAAGRAMLFGRYMGQIKARIDRAWEYPATHSTAAFRCKVQIKQTKQGEVKEVTFQRCDQDPDWQISLAQAIQKASPLSAPPNDAVFTELVTVSFEAQPE